MVRPAKPFETAVILRWLLFLVMITIIAAVTRLWVLTAIPVGFLFGFFLEKADLCGSSAFSEILLMKDSRKLQGILVAIVTSMVGFSFLNGLGLITLNPKPLLWASHIVGGVLFGVGMVLAGGCISGSLFKTGQGNMNSMAALAAIPLGVAAVEYGPLRGFHHFLINKATTSTVGGPVTLSSITGLSYATLAILLALVTIGAAVLIHRKKKPPKKHLIGERHMPLFKRVVTHPWKPWQAGIAIGILASLAYLSSAASGRNYPLGVTGGVLHAELLVTDYPLTHVWTKAPDKDEVVKKTRHTHAESTPKPHKKVSWWLVAEVISLVIGANVSARLTGKFRLVPKPPDEMLFAFAGGLLAGAGAAIAMGCVIGNILSGFALMSVGTMLFGIVVVLTNWITTYFYMMGGQWKG